MIYDDSHINGASLFIFSLWNRWHMINFLSWSSGNINVALIWRPFDYIEHITTLVFEIQWDITNQLGMTFEH